MTPVAIYVRVSSKRQDYQRQISELQAIADKMNYQVIQVITEVGSATKRRRAERPELQQLLDLASGGTIQKILVSEISRLGRRTSETLDLIERLSEMKVSIYAKNLSLETLMDDGRRSAAATIVFTVLSEVARAETEGLRERIHSGLDEARRQNKTLGRPAGSTQSDAKLLEKYPQVVKYLRKKKSIRETAKLAGVSMATVVKVRDVCCKTVTN